MNATTCIISPNWITWALLGIIAIALIIGAWGICKIFAVTAHKNIKGLFSIPPFYKGMIWGIAVVEVLLVGILGYICFAKVDMRDGDAAGVYMSAFSVLITFLVGWQIYNSILSREQIKDINNDIHTRTSKVLYYNMFHVFFIQGANEHKQKNYESALNYYFRCMDCAYKGCLSNELNMLIRKIKRIVDEPQAKVGINDCLTYLEIVAVIDHRDKEYIMTKLDSIKSPDASEQGDQWTITNDANL